MEQLHQYFGSLQAAWDADERQLKQAGLDRDTLSSVLRYRVSLDVWREAEQLARRGIDWLTPLDGDYPELLRSLPDAPPVLYVRGVLTPADMKALAVVGTRSATRYGREAAHKLTQELARQGVTIISGLAHGIDAAAHRGALAGGGRTLAVLGSGVDVLYPTDHGELAAAVVERGALVSEFPLGTRPERGNFPRRNRLISGMALGVLIVEAPRGSGALITAAMAAEQGREVFAVPGSIFAGESWGANRLIQDGAKLVMGVDDILEELDLAYAHTETRQTAERVAPASDAEASILRLLDIQQAIHVDELVRQSGLPTPTVISTLTILELKGLAQTVGAMHYCLTYE